jgi:hypothetical protein
VAAVRGGKIAARAIDAELRREVAA